MDHREQLDTDIPGVWRCQVEPESDLYGGRIGKLLDPVKVVKGRLTDLRHMNARLGRRGGHPQGYQDRNVEVVDEVMTPACEVELSCSSTTSSNARTFIKVRHC